MNRAEKDWLSQESVHTPNVRTIEEVSEIFKSDSSGYCENINF